MAEIEHKRLTVKELSAEGQLQAVISTFDNIDRDGDIMLAAAFEGSRGKTIPMVWSHDWSLPIGKGKVSLTDTEAVFTGSFFLETDAGVNAYKTVKAMGELQEYSIGFRIRDADFGYKEDEAGARQYVRTIKDIELFEASPVLVGAAIGTRTLAVKALEEKAEWTAAYINSLPDSSFAIVLPGGDKDDEGKTVPRSLRKLPHHNAEGAIDVPHLRNALSREPQSDMSADQHSRAKAHLQRHAQAEGVGTDEDGKAIAGILVAIDHFTELKADRQLSEANAEAVREAVGALQALLEDEDNGEPDDDKDTEETGYLSPERKAQLRELERTLGFRPLLAGGARLD